MNPKEYKRVKPANTVKTHNAMPIVLTQKIHRNGPCPCGSTKIIEGTNQEVPVKFKHCCLK